MSSLEKKRKVNEKKSSLVLPQTLQFLSLPHDLVVSSLARVSRLYYPTLSLVSKKFRSLLASAELYETRSLLNCTESCLYVCLGFPQDPYPRWFTLYQKPNRIPRNHSRNKTKKKPNGNILVPISAPCRAKAYSSKPVVVGSDIYVIGGIINGVPSSSVSVLDCRSHTWHEAPNMCEERDWLSANVIDGKIYVVGGRKNRSFSGWIEVFDPKTQNWKSLSSPGSEIYEDEYVETVVIDGKLYIHGKGVSYNPKDGKCEPVKWIHNVFTAWGNSLCVINNVLFGYHGEKGFKWYDTKVRKWRKLKGLKRSAKFPNYTSFTLVDYGGKMVVFWVEDVPDHRCTRSTRIWCAEIALERCNNEEDISGKVVWVDVVLELPIRCRILNVLAATV